MNALSLKWLNQADKLQARCDKLAYGTRSKPQLLREIRTLIRCAKELDQQQPRNDHGNRQ
jgi:hypothetical protein